MGLARHHIWWAADCLYRRLLRRMVVRAFNAELLYSMAERVGMHVEDSRRAFRPLNHSGGQLKGSQNMTSLDLFQRRERGSRRSDRQRLPRRFLGLSKIAFGDKVRSQFVL